MSESFSYSITSMSQYNLLSQSQNIITNFFKDTIKKSGISLSAGDGPNVLSQGQALVVRDIKKSLEAHESSTGAISKFLQGFKVLIKKERYFQKSMLPTLYKKPDGDTDTIACEQESLFRIFLKVDGLQEGTLSIIFEHIGNNVGNCEDLSQLRLLLKQLQYLPYVCDSASLRNNLLNTLEIATLPAQMEILNWLPEILPDSECEQTAQELNELLSTQPDLSSSIIDCLNALNLDLEQRTAIQKQILKDILPQASARTFPIILEFLLDDCKSENLQTTLMEIRSILDNLMSSNGNANSDEETDKTIIFTCFEKGTNSRIFIETWMNILSGIKSPADHKPIDYLIIFLLHSSEKVKKRLVENLVRKKVKIGHFKTQSLEKMFRTYLPPQFLKQYMGSIIQIGCSLLRASREIPITEFATILFQLLFTHEKTQSIYRREILENLVRLINFMHVDRITPILKIFKTLIEDHASLVQLHVQLFPPLLEKVSTFHLKDVKFLFEILCKLISSDDSLSVTRQDLHMVIRKQLSSSQKHVKYRGIVAAVVLVKYTASTDQNQSETSHSEDSITINQLTGEAREAAAILEMAKSSTGNTGELLAFYYDQVAWMLLTSENLEKNFMSWLYESLTHDFQETFTTDSICEDFEEIEFSMQYNLNRHDELANQIAVNIAELSVKNDQKITILASYFRLLRLLHYKHQDGDLGTIDALLGCPVVLPKYDSVDVLATPQIKLVANCLFHCINWFREVINAFVNQKRRSLKRRTAQRLRNVVELERTLDECISNVPDHRFPRSYFNSQQQGGTDGVFKEPKRPPAKKPRLEIEHATPSTSKKREPKKTGAVLKPTVEFREMDTDVLTMLQYDLEGADGEESGEVIRLSVEQLNFLLKDFVKKLNHFIADNSKELSSLDVVTPAHFIQDSVKFLSDINRHFSYVNLKIKTLANECDGMLDAPELYTDDAKTLITAFGLSIEILALLFNWHGFQHSNNLDLLKDCLRAFRVSELSQNIHSAHRLVANLVNYLSDLADHCLCLNHAVDLIKTMEGLNTVTPTPEIRTKIAKTSARFLTRKWCNQIGTYDSGKNASANIEQLVKCYLSNANIRTVNGLVGTLQDQVKGLRSKQDRLDMLPSIDKSNVYILYRNLWNTLHDRLKIELEGLTNAQHLTLWRNVAETMEGLMDINESHRSKSNLLCSLKKSIAILKIFVSHGIPMLEIMLRNRSEEVVQIFRSVQFSTRFLHRVCCQSKAAKDTAVMTYVPQFRSTNEILVFRVKAALVANNCSEAFHMGNLKNRNLEGQDILSQSSETSVESNEDEELPEDESDDEEDEDSNTERRDSEVY